MNRRAPQPPKADDRALVRVLKALAHDKRLRMVREIAAAGELSCSQVAERFTLSQPTISHHLKILRDAGLLLARQDGQTHYIRVDEALVDRVLASLPRRLTTRKRARPHRRR
jgi:ArsR family transcriptional regulator